jgi:photosystem II biogenesis protein Psp29
VNSAVNNVRTVSETKRDFLKDFPKPINSIYRRVVDELLVEVHLLTVNQSFALDSIFALGFVTAFDRFTVGYQPEADRQAIFAAVSRALLLDPDRLHQEAAHTKEIAMRSPGELKNLLTTLETTADLDPLMGLVRAIAANPKFKYSRIFGVGLFTLLEMAEPQSITDNDKRQALIDQVGNTLNIGAERLSKDLDLYRSNLEKLEQGRQMMADLAEAERKKRDKLTKKAELPTETSEDLSANPSTSPSPEAGKES